LIGRANSMVSCTVLVEARDGLPFLSFLATNEVFVFDWMSFFSSFQTLTVYVIETTSPALAGTRVKPVSMSSASETEMKVPSGPFCSLTAQIRTLTLSPGFPSDVLISALLWFLSPVASGTPVIMTE